MSNLNRNLHRALNNRKLDEAVLKSCLHSSAARKKVIADIPDYEAVRDQIREVRQRSIDRNSELIDRFTDRFRAAGGQVHVAQDGVQACSVAVMILESHNCRSGVKSKSMVSEEIQLTNALERAGLDAVESDLGEFIVQLAGEPPSHITAPALHRSRYDIGELFAEKLGIPYTDDPSELTNAAREILRQRFLNADFGISGANFIVAETGHLAIVENEGNVRMGLSLPKTYIAITGIEKVVENLTDIPLILKLLGRSATGQRATGYFNLLKPGSEGEDGPEEMHVVLVDNGRSRAMQDTLMREMMLCIRCGACLNICPVYRSTGGHAYGSVYPGPMGAVLSSLVGVESLVKDELPYLSTLCGACREVCPVRIDIPKLLLELRRRSEKSVIERIAAAGWSWSMKSRSRYEYAGRIIRKAAGLLPGSLAKGWFTDDESAFREGRLDRESNEESR